MPPAAVGSTSAAGESTTLAALVLLAAGGFVVAEPWHGPMVLALSEHHGLDAADLPAVALVALALATRRRRAGGRIAAVAAVLLGLLLIAGVLVPRLGSPLVPAGGGTFGGTPQHVDGRRAEPVDRWTHLAVTYDGARYRLYVDGHQVSSRSGSGAILRTTDPLWIGGNHPYGEYFRGTIDEVRVYDRALARADVVAAISAPLGRGAGPDRDHLVAAYPFDAGRGRTATDASGRGNAGSILGATWTRSGRFGAGIRFAGADQLVRVPPSAALDLGHAMTLMAWIRPSEPQSGWRTVLARQTDAYFLAAGGGREDRRWLELLDRARFIFAILLIGLIGAALARGPVARRSWAVPVTLFAAGSLVDVAFSPVDTLVGPALLALWCAGVSPRRDVQLGMTVLAAAFAAATVLSIAGRTPPALPADDGGVVRSAALGALLVLAGVLSAARRAERG